MTGTRWWTSANTGSRKTFKQIIKSIAFSYLLMVVAAVDFCTCLCSYLGGIISTVVCDHINIKELARVVLCF